MTRPNMRAYFEAEIDQHVNGMAATTIPRLPFGVAKVDGSVTTATIVVTMRNGVKWWWTGGKYAARKVNGCYAPKMPRPIRTPSSNSA